MVELRRFQRTPIDEDVNIVDTKTGVKGRGRARDICLGGMFIETRVVFPFGASVTVELRTPEATMLLPGVVRWTRADGMGVQFGLIGAKETHIITEMTRVEEA